MEVGEDENQAKWNKGFKSQDVASLRRADGTKVILLGAGYILILDPGHRLGKSINVHWTRHMACIFPVPLIYSNKKF